MIIIDLRNHYQEGIEIANAVIEQHGYQKWTGLVY